jgi:hypothetical protein
LKRAAALYYTQYYTGPSEHCAVVVWPRGGHPTGSDEQFCVISLVTTLTGNPAENTHCKKNRYTMCLCCLFSNSMECSALCEVLINQIMLNYLVWFIVTVRMLTADHSHNFCYYYDVSLWTVFVSFKQQQVIFVDEALQILKYKIDFNIIFPSESSSKHFNKYNTISLTPLPPPFLPTLHPIILTQYADNTQSS